MRVKSVSLVFHFAKRINSRFYNRTAVLMAGHIRFHRHNLNTIFAAFLCHFVQRLFSAGTQNQIRTLLRKKNRCCFANT